MGLYLYCFVPPDAGPAETLAGIDNAPVRLQGSGAIGYWVSPLEAPPEPTIENVRRHDQVVEEALALGVTPLPVRFGQWLADAGALQAAVRDREAAYVAALRTLENTVEFGLRVLDPGLDLATPADVPAGSSGTAYMHALAGRAAGERQVEVRGREIASRISAVLGSIVRQERIEALPSRHGLVSIAHLVERGCDAEYRSGMDAVRREYPGLRFLLTGPWPPYSFAP